MERPGVKPRGRSSPLGVGWVLASGSAPSSVGFAPAWLLLVLAPRRSWLCAALTALEKGRVNPKLLRFRLRVRG